MMWSFSVPFKCVLSRVWLTFFVFLLTLFCTCVNSRMEPVKSKVFEGDIMMSRKEMKTMQNELLFTGKVHPITTWPNGKIPYLISPKFDEKSKDMILRAMPEISGDTCIDFVPRTNEKDYVDFVLGKNKCSSKVGKAGKRQEIIMSPECMRHGTIVHELLHALGSFITVKAKHVRKFMHKPDRDEHITIQWDNLKTPESKRNFEKYGTGFNTKQMPYDYGSITHYSAVAFSKSAGEKTIVSKIPNAPIGQRTSMSHFDKIKINIMYNCPVVSN